MRFLSDGVDTVVLGTDFTPLSEVAFQAAVRSALLFDAQLHILHAHEETLMLRGRGGGEDVRGFIEDLSYRRVQWLAQLEARARQVGVSAQAVTRGGAASTAIVGYAEEVDAGLVVLGMVGSGGIRRLLTGSTAKRVMRHAERPVLTVSANAQVEPATRASSDAPWRHVLYPTDLSRASRDGLAAAVQIAGAANARLTVAHVLKMPGVVPSMPGEPTMMMPRGAVDGLAAHVEDELQAWTTDLGLTDVNSVVTSRTDPAEGICELAEREGADLIALPRRSSGVGHFLFGSTAEQVAMIAPVPVLAFTPPVGARPTR